jgi:hypothetical protein
MAVLRGYSWLSHSDRRIVSLADQPIDFGRGAPAESSALAATLAPGALELRRDFVFGPARIRLADRSRSFLIERSEHGEGAPPTRVHIVDASGATHSLSRYNPHEEFDVNRKMSLETKLVERIDWLPIHGASAHLDDRGFLVLGDGPKLDYHLLRWTDARANGARVKLRIVAKPAESCNTNLYVHHWGPQDVCSIAKDGTVVLSEATEDLRVDHRYDGFLEVNVTFQNHHDTVSIGLGNPGGHYEGTGTPQYIFKSIDIELLPLNPIRQMLIGRLWRGNDPFRGLLGNLFEFDLQGWGSQHEYLSDAIEQLRPSVIVEVGVWKGGSTVFMADVAKRLGLPTVVIAVDTWLGSSEHWLHSNLFSEMSFLNGYPALYHKFLSNAIRAGVANYVMPIPIASLGAAEILASLGVTASIIHVDGAHDYDSVTADLRAWWPLVAAGGVLIGDDYTPAGGWASVRQAFDDFFHGLGLPIENTEGKCRIRKPDPAAEVKS